LSTEETLSGTKEPEIINEDLNQSSDLSSGISPASIEDEMQKSYLDYAMSVIVSRALPDCRDGLKPVQRRILYAMYDTGNRYNKSYRKSAKVVGEVLGNYHPHGDSSIYGALARMAQDFALNIPLIDGQGNFGSVDGDPPAQMRYTEVRLSKLADTNLLADIDKNTVEFQENYDNSTTEPRVLPAKFPNILVNGASGIAVGMATNIPTYNLGEVIQGCLAYLSNENITGEELLQHVAGPDFPTGGEIVGVTKLKNALLTGKGIITVRGKLSIETPTTNSKSIVITEIPYQVNKSELVKSIEDLARNKIIEGITEIRDESNKLGMRVVIDIRRDVDGEIVLNQLYRRTQLQTSFGINMLALKDNIPILMSLLDIISSFIKFREEVVSRRIAFLLNKARMRAHILVGLLIAVDNIDEVIRIIRNSANVDVARGRLMEQKWRTDAMLEILRLVEDLRNKVDADNSCYLSLEQSQAILDMRLQRLTNLERTKITDEFTALEAEINEYLSILRDRNRILNIIREELTEIANTFHTPRRTQIVDADLDVSDESLIQKEDMVVTVTRTGYIKRTALLSYKSQKRGGKGRSAMTVAEDDIITDLIVTDTHDSLLFFSNIGRVYKLKVYKLPVGSMQSKGRAIVNILPLDNGERITTIISLGNVEEGDNIDDKKYIIFATALGNVRRNALSDFANIMSSGKIAIRLEERDRLIGVVLCKQSEHVLLATAKGKAVRFLVANLRVFRSRTSDGVRGVRLSLVDDSVISISILHGIDMDGEIRDIFLKIPVEQRMELGKVVDQEQAIALASELLSQVPQNDQRLTAEDAIKFAQQEQFILTVNNKGYGKRTSAYEYRIVGRGSQGIINMNLPHTHITIIASFAIDNNEEIIVVTKSGTVIRLPVDDIRITGRSAIGVRVINLKGGGDEVSSVTRIVSDAEDAQDENADVEF